MPIARTVSSVLAAALLVGGVPRVAEAALLLQQAPSAAADAVVVGSDGQALWPAETFTITQTANSLSWWGTLGVDFSVQIFAATDLATPLATPLVEYLPTYAGLQPSFVLSIDGTNRDIFRFDLDLGALQAGDYAVSIAELTTDPDIVDTWYWVRGSAGDGSSLFGLGDPGGGPFDFDLSLRLDAAGGGQVPLPPTLSLALLSMLAAGAAGARRRRVGAADPG